MTAVATQTQIPNGLPRHGWTTNGNNILSMTSDFVPSRKVVQRSNSSSSLSSNSSTSSSSTISAPPQTNGIPNGDTAARKKNGRGLWPTAGGKAEPVSGLSTARPSAAPSSAAAASAISALHTASQNSQKHALNGQAPANGVAHPQSPESPVILALTPLNGTFERKSISVPSAPEVLKIGRQTNAKTLPTPENGFFDSKVLSRQHAEVWADQDGRIWIRDVRSSNGTFVNGKRLSMENRDSEPHPLKEQDVLELGIDIVSEDGKSIVHSKVAARIEHAGIYGASSLEINTATELSPMNGFGQQLPPSFRSRPSSQGSISSSRFSAGGSNNVAAYHSKWLQPVTMEQIAKRLSSELRNARLQSQDLTNTSDFVNAVITHQNPLPIPEPQKISSPSRASEARARFSDPPGPPPSQPLPEKPDAGLRSKLADFPSLQPLLRRSETEKPVLSSADSPTKFDSAAKINNLVEALSSAQRELSDQNERLRTLDESLKQEREARINAEQRAENLSQRSNNTETDEMAVGSLDITETTADQNDPAAAAGRLQEKCELMRNELEGMRLKMEEFRLRAESAEKERDVDRQSLADMVKNIRRRDDAAQKKKTSREQQIALGEDTSRASHQLEWSSSAVADDPDDDVAVMDQELNDQVDAVLKRQTTIKPKPDKTPSLSLPPALRNHLKVLSPTQLDDLGRTIDSIRCRTEQQQQSEREAGPRRETHNQVMHTAPYASIIGVVILGMGMMAYLNSWQKVVERS
ncbi:MAG: hypothetical protein Q9159_003980 [Coniocarpon cinnabarinum]